MADPAPSDRPPRQALPEQADSSVPDASAPDRPAVPGPAAPRSMPPGAQGPQGAMERFALFEQVALGRLRSAADTTRPVAFLPLPVRFTAAAAAGICGLGLLWAVLARVPTHVYGVGVFLPEGGLASARARIAGTLLYQVSGVGPERLPPPERSRRQTLMQFWHQAAREATELLPQPMVIRTLNAVLQPTNGQPFVLPEMRDGVETFDSSRPGGEMERRLFQPAGQLLVEVASIPLQEQLDAARRLASPRLHLQGSIREDRDQRQRNYQQVDQVLRQQRQRLVRELAERHALYSRLQILWKQGYIPSTTLLQERSVINGLKGQVLQLEREMVATGFSRSETRQQAEAARVETLQTRDQVQASLVKYMGDVLEFSPSTGLYVVDVQRRNGTRVNPGDTLFTYSLSPPSLPQTIPVFVGAAVVQQLTEGMRVLVTPKGISRAQYGGIRGVITSVSSRMPLSGDGLVDVAGSGMMASMLLQSIQQPYRLMVQLDLADPAYCRQLMSRRCYRWSTSRVPPSPVRLGSSADVQITTGARPPIDFVMPALRQALGLVVDNR